jgi:hypothetical protein
MVSYKELKTGKKYKLGDIIVGKFVRVDREPDGDVVVIFLDSQYGETGENTIYPDEDDEFEEIERNAGGSMKTKKTKKTKQNNNKTKIKTMKTRTKQKSKKFSRNHKIL